MSAQRQVKPAVWMLPAPKIAGLLPARVASPSKIVYFEPTDGANPYFPRKIGA